MDYPRQREIDPETKDYDALCAAFRWQVPARFNLAHDLCDRHAAHPDRADTVALTYLDADERETRYTFAGLRAASNRLANALAALGLQRGDRLAVWLPQRPETALCHLAAWKLGLVSLPLSVLFRHEALRYRLAHSGASALVCEPEGLPVLAPLLDELPALRTVLVVSARPGEAARGPAQRGRLGPAALLDFDAALGAASDALTPLDTGAEEPAMLIYTSGTTGQPKGALHAQRFLIGHLTGFECSHNFAPQPGDRLWSPADWSWIAGLMDVLTPAWHYGLPVVAAPARGPFDPERALRVLEAHQVRNAFLPPSALKLMAQVESIPRRYALRLRSVMSGGEALGPALLEWIRVNLGAAVNEAYGQTEVNYSAGNCNALFPVRPGSLGKPYPGFRMAVLDEAGTPVAPGTLGELAVKREDNPVFFLAYWNDPVATRAKFAGDWALTGDLVVQDEEGYLWFKGRKDDLINSAGYRIGPAEVEAVLAQHPAVALCAVIGAPDALRGQIVKAFVQPRPGHAPGEGLTAEIQAFVKDRLARHEYPRAIEYVDAFPTTASGKIIRAELRRREEARAAGQPEGH